MHQALIILIATLLFATACDGPNGTGSPSRNTDTPLVRTDFSDDQAWKQVIAEINSPQNEFEAFVNYISDKQYQAMSIQEVMSAYDNKQNHTFLFIVDQETLSNGHHPILVVDLYHQPGRTFRVIPSEMWAVQNNLELANMDWEDFASNTDADGVFRGFP